MKKTRLWLVTILVLMTALLAGCAQQAEPAATPVPTETPAPTEPPKTWEDAAKSISEGNFQEAADILESLGHEKDGYTYLMYRQVLSAVERGEYDYPAAALMDSGLFDRDDPICVYLRARSYEESDNDTLARQTYETIPYFADSMDRIAKLNEAENEQRYQEAVELQEAKKYKEALYAFESMNGYSDSAERMEAIRAVMVQEQYDDAAKLQENKQYWDALDAFTALGGYSDSETRVLEIQETLLENEYETAMRLDELDHIATAKEKIARLGEQFNRREKADALIEEINLREYNLAEENEKNGETVAAYLKYLDLGDYQDSQERAANLRQDATYQMGLQAIHTGDYADAKEYFSRIPEYLDSEAKIRILGIIDIADQVRRLGDDQFGYLLHSKWGLVDLIENRDIAPTWDELEEYGVNGLAIASKSGANGLIDTHGKAVLPFEYDFIQRMNVDDENSIYLAGKRKFQLQQESYSLIKEDGSVLSTWKTIDSKFTNGVVIAIGEDDQYDLLNQKGETILSSKNEISFMSRVTPNDTITEDTEEGIQLYKLDGTILDEHKWASILEAPNQSYLLVQDLEGKEGLIDRKTGKVILEAQYDLIEAFSDELATLKKEGKYGLFDWNHGKVIAEAQFDQINRFSEGLAAVKVGDSWGYINEKGEVVIEPQYRKVTSFSNGNSEVTSDLLGDHYIDTEGKLLYFKESIYQQANELDRAEKYEQAIEIYHALEGYEDSEQLARLAQEKVNAAWYVQANKLAEEGKYAEALALYEQLESQPYQDSAERAKECREQINQTVYEEAATAEAENELEKAVELFESLGDYADSSERMLKIQEKINAQIYSDAMIAYADGKYEEAIALLEQIPGYMDADTLLNAYKEKLKR